MRRRRTAAADGAFGADRSWSRVPRVALAAATTLLAIPAVRDLRRSPRA